MTLSESLPKDYLPTRSCCGMATLDRGPAVYRNDGSVPTSDRWVLVRGWQCAWTKGHCGTWYETTDDAASLPNGGRDAAT